MDIMHSEWKVRIQNWINVLKQELYQPIGEITWTAHKTKEYLTPEQALQAEFEPVTPGYTWGETWEYCWFKGTVTIENEGDDYENAVSIAHFKSEKYPAKNLLKMKITEIYTSSPGPEAGNRLF